MLFCFPSSLNFCPTPLLLQNLAFALGQYTTLTWYTVYRILFLRIFLTIETRIQSRLVSDKWNKLFRFTNEKTIDTFNSSRATNAICLRQIALMARKELSLCMKFEDIMPRLLIRLHFHNKQYSCTVDLIQISLCIYSTERTCL